MGGPANRGPAGDAGALRRAHALLEVSADVDVAELTRAYWRQARRLHPDRSVDPQATQQFQALHDAYRLILDASLERALHASGDQQSRHGKSSQTVGTSAGGNRISRDPPSRDQTRPGQPSVTGPAAVDAAGPALPDGLWVVAGPVHVQPPRRPDTTRSPWEGDDER